MLKQMKKSEVIILRVGLIILGLLLFLMGLYFNILLPFAIIIFYLAHCCKKELKERKKIKLEKSKPADQAAVPEETTESAEELKKPIKTVKVTDLDGSIRELSVEFHLEDDKVLVAEGGKTYHTYLGCFKNWQPEIIDGFTGWKILKKSEAISQNMKLCSFCENKQKTKMLCRDIYEEYKKLLRGYKDSDTEEKVYILKECYRKLGVIKEKDIFCEDIDIYEEYEKIEKKARLFINAYIKEEREAGNDDYMIDITQFSFDLDFISDYIYEKDEKLNKM